MTHKMDPLIILIGGAAGTGKTSTAKSLCNQLDIAHRLGSGFIREIAKSFVPKNEQPFLYNFSFRPHVDISPFENLYQHKFGAFDYDVDSFGFAVAMVKNTFGVIPLAVENEFSANNYGYHYHAACIDHDYLWYRYYAGKCIVKGCGYSTSDIHTHKEIQQNDQAARKDELFGDVGWDQKHRNSHSWIMWDGTE